MGGNRKKNLQKGGTRKANPNNHDTQTSASENEASKPQYDHYGTQQSSFHPQTDPPDKASREMRRLHISNDNYRSPDKVKGDINSRKTRRGDYPSRSPDRRRQIEAKSNQDNDDEFDFSDDTLTPQNHRNQDSLGAATSSFPPPPSPLPGAIQNSTKSKANTHPQDPALALIPHTTLGSSRSQNTTATKRVENRKSITAEDLTKAAASLKHVSQGTNPQQLTNSVGNSNWSQNIAYQEYQRQGSSRSFSSGQVDNKNAETKATENEMKRVNQHTTAEFNRLILETAKKEVQNRRNDTQTSSARETSDYDDEAETNQDIQVTFDKGQNCYSFGNAQSLRHTARPVNLGSVIHFPRLNRTYRLKREQAIGDVWIGKMVGARLHVMPPKEISEVRWAYICKDEVPILYTILGRATAEDRPPEEPRYEIPSSNQPPQILVRTPKDTTHNQSDRGENKSLTGNISGPIKHNTPVPYETRQGPGYVDTGDPSDFGIQTKRPSVARSFQERPPYQVPFDVPTRLNQTAPEFRQNHVHITPPIDSTPLIPRGGEGHSTYFREKGNEQELGDIPEETSSTCSSNVSSNTFVGGNSVEVERLREHWEEAKKLHLEFLDLEVNYSRDPNHFQPGDILLIMERLTVLKGKILESLEKGQTYAREALTQINPSSRRALQFIRNQIQKRNKVRVLEQEVQDWLVKLDTYRSDYVMARDLADQEEGRPPSQVGYVLPKNTERKVPLDAPNSSRAAQNERGTPKSNRKEQVISNVRDSYLTRQTNEPKNLEQAVDEVIRNRQGKGAQVQRRKHSHQDEFAAYEGRQSHPPSSISYEGIERESIPSPNGQNLPPPTQPVRSFLYSNDPVNNRLMNDYYGHPNQMTSQANKDPDKLPKTPKFDNPSKPPPRDEFPEHSNFKRPPKYPNLSVQDGPQNTLRTEIDHPQVQEILPKMEGFEGQVPYNTQHPPFDFPVGSVTPRTDPALLAILQNQTHLSASTLKILQGNEYQNSLQTSAAQQCVEQIRTLAQSHRESSLGPWMNDVPVFNGDRRQWEDWISAIERITSKFGQNPVFLASMKSTGDVHKLITNKEVEYLNKGKILTWPVLKEELSKEYSTRPTHVHCSRDFIKKPQGADESIERYIDRCTQNAMITSGEVAQNIRDYLYLDTFIGGLYNPKMREKLGALVSPTQEDPNRRFHGTLQDLFQMCRAFHRKGLVTEAFKGYDSLGGISPFDDEGPTIMSIDVGNPESNIGVKSELKPTSTTSVAQTPNTTSSASQTKHVQFETRTNDKEKTSFPRNRPFRNQNNAVARRYNNYLNNKYKGKKFCWRCNGKHLSFEAAVCPQHPCHAQARREVDTGTYDEDDYKPSGIHYHEAKRPKEWPLSVNLIDIGDTVQEPELDPTPIMEGESEDAAFDPNDDTWDQDYKF